MQSETPSIPKKHVLILAYPQYGHLIPILELARRISRYHHVTFALSKERADLLPIKNHFHPKNDEDIEIFGIEDGVPADVTPNLAFGKVVREEIEPRVKQLILEVDFTGDRERKGKTKIRPVDVIVADNFCAAVLSACVERGIPYYLFHTPAIRLLRYLMLIDENTKLIPVTGAPPFPQIPPPGQTVAYMWETIHRIFRHVKDITLSSAGVISTSFHSIETADIALLREDTAFASKPLFCVGPILPTQELRRSDPVIQWLDRQAPRSVVYVSFGSSIGPTDEQTVEVARGLLALKRPFVWSLREEAYHLLPETMQESIREQFEGAGWMMVKWAPQMGVLHHQATAVFVSHCGWNSTMEGLSAGVPFVAWPQFADQKLNAQWLVERGVAYMLSEEGRTGKLVAAAEITRGIENVVGWAELNAKQPSGYQEAAEKWKQEIQVAAGPDGSSTREFLDLMQFQQLVN